MTKLFNKLNLKKSNKLIEYQNINLINTKQSPLIKNYKTVKRITGN